MKYNYEELRAAAIAPDATAKDLEALADWFQEYDTNAWNGEYYDADGYRLYPVYKETEPDEYEVSGWELR